MKTRAKYSNASSCQTTKKNLIRQRVRRAVLGWREYELWSADFYGKIKLKAPLQRYRLLSCAFLVPENIIQNLGQAGTEFQYSFFVRIFGLSCCATGRFCGRIEVL